MHGGNGISEPISIDLYFMASNTSCFLKKKFIPFCSLNPSLRDISISISPSKKDTFSNRIAFFNALMHKSTSLSDARK